MVEDKIRKGENVGWICQHYSFPKSIFKSPFASGIQAQGIRIKGKVIPFSDESNKKEF